MDEKNNNIESENKNIISDEEITNEDTITEEKHKIESVEQSAEEKTLSELEQSQNSNENINNKDNKENKSLGWEILLFLRDLAIMIIVVALFTTFIADRTKVIGNSMEPHIHDGDLFVLNKITYRFSEPERYDIIVFPYNHGQSNYIKRIIGLPGETVEILDGEVIINGEVLGENFGMEEIRYDGNQKYPLTIPEDEYFVMGDNRNNSTDSRYQDVGTIKKEDIIGKAGLRIYPFSGFGFVE